MREVNVPASGMLLHLPGWGIKVYPEGAPPAGGFSPSDIAGLIAWYKADAIIGLSDGDPVANWPDSSLHGYDASQGESDFQPSYKAGILNGKPVVRFDGIDDHLIAGAIAGLSGQITVFLVRKQSSVVGYPVPWMFHVGDTSYLHLHVPYETTSSFWSRRTAVRTNPQVDAVSFYLLDWIEDGSQAILSKNANPQATYTGGNPPALNQANLILTLGAYRAAEGFYAGFIAGDVAELIIYDSALSGDDPANVRAYLNSKYAIY